MGAKGVNTSGCEARERSLTLQPMASAIPPATRLRRTSAETREHVLDVAATLFYWDGIRATGIDRIAAEAGVAPPTLYRVFGSKEALVAAYLDSCDRAYRDALETATAADGRAPRERLLALFDEQAAAVRPEHCRGCPFLMALAEFPDAASAPHAGAVATKAWVRALLARLAAELGVAAPTALADQLALVVEGVYASVQALGVDGPTAQARSTAEILIDAALAAA